MKELTIENGELTIFGYKWIIKPLITNERQQWVCYSGEGRNPYATELSLKANLIGFVVK